MQIVLHETPQAYEQEYQRVRGALVSQGTSLNAWLSANGIERRLACHALRGKSFGKKAVELRAKILREVLGKSASL